MPDDIIVLLDDETKQCHVNGKPVPGEITEVNSILKEPGVWEGTVHYKVNEGNGFTIVAVSGTITVETVG